VDRRHFLHASAAGALLAASPLRALAAGQLGPAGLPSGALESAVLDTLPGRVPLIKRTWRPPNFETPTAYFNDAFTRNEAFFVRYHLANIPEVDAASWRLTIGGPAAEKALELDLEQLKRGFEQVEVAALCICSGNRRGLSNPHVPGVQWGNGAMGNARWKGVRLRDVLNRAGVKADALEVVADGADAAVLDKTPDFVKSIPVWKALDENTLIAWEMNGEPLPHWNGYPVRLVVPGWTATYWMKHLTSLKLVNEPYKGFWMATAYRIPKGKFAIVDRFLTQETDTNTPITEMVVSSLVTNLRDGSVLPGGKPAMVRGVAWDGGFGMQTVEVSLDGGKLWRPADLGADLGRYAWRQWSFPIASPQPGDEHVVMAKATNRIGSSQTFELVFNPAGYHNNVVQPVRVKFA
jgi:DMSO/TMAO reductase YedYZ molybdopterin-dependent catalytic subunit